MKTKYVVLTGLGMMITSSLVPQMYEVRGMFAIGGEWLIVPLLLLCGTAQELIILPNSNRTNYLPAQK